MAQSNGLVVIGTDTGVGKTIVTAAICLLARAQGKDWVPLKAVQTGGIRHAGGLLTAPDLDWILTATGIDASPEDRQRMSPYVFEFPASPHLSAELQGSVIDPHVIIQSFEALASRHDGVVIEGVGGLMVPMGRNWTLVDLIRKLNLPVVVVARSGLGTLNHTFLTLAALRASRVSIAGVILNHQRPQAPGIIERDNARILSEMGDVHIWGTLPFAPELCDPSVPAVVLRAKLGDCAAEMSIPVSRAIRR